MKLLLFFIDHHMIFYPLSCDKNCTFDCGPRLIGERERERGGGMVFYTCSHLDFAVERVHSFKCFFSTTSGMAGHCDK